jgi:hypothetical protein
MRASKSFTAGFELCFGDKTVHEAQVQGPLGGYRFAGEYEFESHFGPHQVRKNCRSERRKHAYGYFWLCKARLGCGDDHVAEGGELRSAADRGSVDHANDRLCDVHHGCKSSVKGVEHLENTLRSVFANLDAATEDLAGRIEENDLDVFAGTNMLDAFGQLAQHGLVEKIVFRAAQGHASDAAVQTDFYEFVVFDLFLLRQNYEFFGTDRFDHHRLRAGG